MSVWFNWGPIKVCSDRLILRWKKPTCDISLQAQRFVHLMLRWTVDETGTNKVKVQDNKHEYEEAVQVEHLTEISVKTEWPGG